MAFACNVRGIPDQVLEFFGYYLKSENDEFKVYFHKEGDQIVKKDNPILYVEDRNDAAYLNAIEVTVLGKAPDPANEDGDDDESD